MSRNGNTSGQRDPARARLARERPRPDPEFRRRLRRDVATLWGATVRPANLWLIVAGLIALAVVLGVIAIAVALH